VQTPRHGLYRIITGNEVKPTAPAVTQTQVAGAIYPPLTPVQDLLRAWTEQNDTAYNQIILTVSSEIQSLLDDTDEAHVAWIILRNKFESTDPSKISVVRAKYDNYHMVDG
jgi:hypothetical protein